MKAINLLELNLCDEDTVHPHYFLDFAILMALYYLQLYFVERVMSGKKKFRRKLEDYIFYDKWTLFQKNNLETFDERVSEILEKLDAFDNFQKEYASNDPDTFSQNFADQFRKGMRVINGG